MSDSAFAHRRGVPPACGPCRDNCRWPRGRRRACRRNFQNRPRRRPASNAATRGLSPGFSTRDPPANSCARGEQRMELTAGAWVWPTNSIPGSESSQAWNSASTDGFLAVASTRELSSVPSTSASLKLVLSSSVSSVFERHSTTPFLSSVPRLQPLALTRKFRRSTWPRRCPRPGWPSGARGRPACARGRAGVLIFHGGRARARRNEFEVFCVAFG
jgi:hypothetical protein